MIDYNKICCKNNQLLQDNTLFLLIIFLFEPFDPKLFEQQISRKPHLAKFLDLQVLDEVLAKTWQFLSKSWPRRDKFWASWPSFDKSWVKTFAYFVVLFSFVLQQKNRYAFLPRWYRKNKKMRALPWSSLDRDSKTLWYRLTMQVMASPLYPLKKSWFPSEYTVPFKLIDAQVRNSSVSFKNFFESKFDKF